MPKICDFGKVVALYIAKRFLMMKYNCYIIAALMALSAAASEKKWTADDCMRYAIENNFDVKSAEITHDNDRLDYKKAVGSFFPTVGASLSLQGSFGRSIDPATNTYDNLRTLSNGYGLSLSWDIFTGGQIINQFKRAKAQKQMSESALQSRRDEIAINVLDAFVNLQYYTELMKITGLKLEESRAVLAQTQRMKELGLKSAVDVSQAEAQVADDDYTHTNTQSMFTNSLITLKNTMNFPVADTLELAGPENSIYSGGGTRSTIEIMEFARSNNPIMRQAELSKNIAKYSLRSAKGAWTPSISISAGLSDSYYKRYGTENQPYKEQMNANFGQYVGVSMSIPIFDGLSRSNSVKKAKNQAVEAQIDYDRKLYELQTSVEQAVTDCNNAEKEALKMEKKEISDSVAYRFAKRKYDEGLMSFLDMRETMNTWFESQAELVRCRLLFDVKRRLVDYYRTNRIYQETINE